MVMHSGRSSENEDMGHFVYPTFSLQVFFVLTCFFLNYIYMAIQ